MRPHAEKVLVIGGGPAGLEAAMSAGRRGCEVVLVEATREIGGRAARESRLPGLGEWRRVVDYRVGQIDRLPNVEYYLESEMTVDEAFGYDFDHIAVATGARWRRDGVGIHHRHPLAFDDSVVLCTPDDLMGGTVPSGRVVVFDDDHFYMGGVVAELLARAGAQVTLVTSEAEVSSYTHKTMEQFRIHRLLLELSVEIKPHTVITGTSGGSVGTERTVDRAVAAIAADALVLVTARLPNDDLFQEFVARRDEWGGIKSVRAVGDAYVPHVIAGAVWDGRRWAEELDGSQDNAVFRRNVLTV